MANPWNSADPLVRALIEVYWSRDPEPAVWDAAREALLGLEINPDAWRPSIDYRTSKVAGAGLYGYTVGVQKTAEGAIKRLRKTAERIVKAAVAKDDQVITFLVRHAERDGSKAAKLLISVYKDSMPKLAATKGMYGLRARAVQIGMQACVDVRIAAGEIAAGLREKPEGSVLIPGFLERHADEGSCISAGLLWSCYPDGE